MKIKLMTVFAVMMLSGCMSTKEPAPIPDDPYYAPIFPEEENSNIVPSGSLFKVNYSNSIYSDAKARRIGDIITVILQENTQASKSAKAEYGKENGIDLQPISAFGKNATWKGNPLALSLDYETEFKGDSKADQSNSLNGQVSVHVIKILPNGNLIVRGEKWLTLNTGKEYVRLTGILRPADISSDNTIGSNRVANARIEYSGTGSFADANKQGWLSKFFYSDWFPF
ncbi:flagellar basal body L-ring protein FlgH [Catenovulum sp. SM1970]|uniref:flagellar basal body L-ring protein FlgH n=1 Tax=Marinifaba aquimaris TaxID=2741323 RepID=UPI0015749790|nr:flagellar basal body L-ring protein FlgH [Marinifaba aquimaris]NTS75398.1 flagellar basal body L-ring protein FlgH [Marinifaba aquimaris]